MQKSVKRANLFMLLLLIYMQALMIALLFVSVFIETLFGIVLPLHLLQNASLILSFGAPFIVYLAATGQKIPDVLPLQPLGAVNTFYVIVITICVMPFMMAVSAVSSALFDNNAAVFLDEMMAFPAVTVTISVAVVPAVFEEITFRGVILSNYKHMSIKKAAVISGLFFGLMHMDLQQLPYAFLMGVVLAYLVIYTKSIFASVLSHFTVNASMVAISYLFAETPPDAQGSLGNDILSLAPFLMISVPLFVIAFMKFTQYNEKNISDRPVENLRRDNVATWEFWAMLAVYIAAVLFAYL